ncbi:potassium-transporting ATPase subunit KdpC [Kyrpidia tusciae]|uniref:Potassium-transporting ATPase KdpC subunit n=1 Tax=Kyrpidia tusciae (strain DSM 2912 / NBRC 15312 / T2) TaxID=562970 RepID=D5WU12_KYRT2|nr:potassium-transporting ATPase subunit KdpC [Kyrpidia tusciae]ADG05332.1 potassium-transporting ATPase, C subunit [Kyrpidia tusciae DSM 2912]
MARTWWTAVRSVLVLTVLTGVAYPLVVTGLAQLLFPWQANGSLVESGGRVVGSALIGQTFQDPRYFHGRPSAAGQGYDAESSSGSNAGPTNPDYLKTVQERVDQVRQENGLPPGAPVPSDLVTASGSGLDPDISLSAARIQIPRVAAARHLSVQQVEQVVQQHVRGLQWGLFGGGPRVNVLELNLALDRMSG